MPDVLKYYLTRVSTTVPALPPTGESTKLAFVVYDADNQPPDKPDEFVPVVFNLHFPDGVEFDVEKTPALRIAAVGGKPAGPWQQSVRLQPDATGGVLVELRSGTETVSTELDVFLSGVKASDRDRYHHFDLKQSESVIEVDELRIVSGDNQFSPLDDPGFQPLKVKALFNGKEVVGARVTFKVDSPVTSETVAIKSAAPPTIADGTTLVELVKGTKTGLFTVTAIVGKAAPAIFHVALGPEKNQLEVVFEQSVLSLHQQLQEVGQCRVRICTRGTKTGWPYVHCQATTSSDAVLFKPGEVGSILLISDESGLLRPVGKSDNLEVIAKKRGNAILNINIMITSTIILSSKKHMTVESLPG